MYMYCFKIYSTWLCWLSRWSLGAILFEMLVGYPPFYADEPITTCRKVMLAFGFPSVKYKLTLGAFSIYSFHIMLPILVHCMNFMFKANIFVVKRQFYSPCVGGRMWMGKWSYFYLLSSHRDKKIYGHKFSEYIIWKSTHLRSEIHWVNWKVL